MTITTAVMQLFNSLSISSVLLMVALGLSITFGITLWLGSRKLLNDSHPATNPATIESMEG